MNATTESLEILVNGEARTVAAGTTLPGLLAAEGVDVEAARGIAVAVNEEVVRRAVWAEVTLGAGDRVEIVTANAGG